MSKFLFSPGPTHVPAEVLERMSSEPIHHRSDAFREVFLRCCRGLKKVFQTDGEIAIISATGTAAMEAAVINVVGEGSKAVYIEGGKFGRRWGELCRCLGVETIPLKVKMGESLAPQTLDSALKSHPDVKAVFLTQVESSSGALFDIQSLAEVVRERTEAAIVVDVIGSLGADRFLQDEWGVDIAVSASQKGLMCPPGLSFVSVSTEGMKKLIKPPSLYLELNRYFTALDRGDTPFTPAINLFFGLEAALEMILSRGMETVWAETERLAGAFRQSMKYAGLEIFPREPASALSVISLPDGFRDKEVIARLEDKTGYRIAGGQDEIAGRVIRVAHMGAVGFDDLKRLIPPLFGVLKDLGWEVEVENVLKVFEGSYKKEAVGWD